MNFPIDRHALWETTAHSYYYQWRYRCWNWHSAAFGWIDKVNQMLDTQQELQQSNSPKILVTNFPILCCSLLIAAKVETRWEYKFLSFVSVTSKQHFIIYVTIIRFCLGRVDADADANADDKNDTPTPSCRRLVVVECEFVCRCRFFIWLMSN